MFGNLLGRPKTKKCTHNILDLLLLFKSGNFFPAAVGTTINEQFMAK